MARESKNETEIRKPAISRREFLRAAVYLTIPLAAAACTPRFPEQETNPSESGPPENPPPLPAAEPSSVIKQIEPIEAEIMPTNTLEASRFSNWETSALNHFNIDLDSTQAGQFLNLADALWGYDAQGNPVDPNSSIQEFGGVVALHRAKAERIGQIVSEFVDPTLPRQDWLNQDRLVVEVDGAGQPDEIFPPGTVFFSVDDRQRLEGETAQQHRDRTLLVLRPPQGGHLEFTQVEDQVTIVAKDANEETVKILNPSKRVWIVPLSDENGSSFYLEQKPGLLEEEITGVYLNGEENPLPPIPEEAQSLQHYLDPQTNEVFLVEPQTGGEAGPQARYHLVTNPETNERNWEKWLSQEEFLKNKDAEWVEMGYLPDGGEIYEVKMVVNGEERKFLGYRHGTLQLLIDKKFVDLEADFALGGHKFPGEIPIVGNTIADAVQRVEQLGFIPHAIQVTEKFVEELGLEEATKKGLVFMRRDQTTWDPTWFERYANFIDQNPDTTYELRGSVPWEGGVETIMETLGQVNASLPVTVVMLPPIMEKSYALEHGIIGGDTRAPFGLGIREGTEGFFGIEIEAGTGKLTVLESGYLFNGKLISRKSHGPSHSTSLEILSGSDFLRSSTMTASPEVSTLVIGSVLLHNLFYEKREDNTRYGLFDWEKLE